MNQRFRALLAAPSLVVATTAALWAEGTENLATPAGIQLAAGTEIVLSGTGLAGTQPGLITSELPEGATVLQVIAYWDGLALTGSLPGDTDTIFLGGVPVTGQLIGGPSNFIGAFHSFAFRADITDLALLDTGSNALSVDGLDFGFVNNGLSLLVVLDDGSGARDISLRDGSDFAFGGFGGDFTSTEAQTYSFTSSDQEREAQLGFVVSGVGEGRPNVIEITIGDNTTRYADVLGSTAGAEWDVVEFDLLIPEGVDTVTARVLSEDLGTGISAGGQIASLNWIASTFEIELNSPGFGCSPYFWFTNWTTWDPWDTSDNKTGSVVLTDRFNETFGVHWYHSGLSSFSKLWWGLKGIGFWIGWEHRLLNRHAVTALANADAGIGYPMSVEEVKALYRDAVGADSGPETIWSALATFQAANSLGCPW